MAGIESVESAVSTLSAESAISPVALESVTFREFHGSDMKYLEDLLYELWLDNILKNNTRVTHGKNFAGLSKVKGLISRDYLLSYLNHSTYAVTAVLPSGIPCGYLLGSCSICGKNRPTVRSVSISLRQHITDIILKTTKYGRIYLEHREDTQRAFSILSRSVPKDCGGEVILFAVRGDVGGIGIGSRLMNDFKEYLRSNGCGRYFLCADDYCNKDYYEKHGYKRISSTDVDYKDGRKGKQFHLYVRDL